MATETPPKNRQERFVGQNPLPDEIQILRLLSIRSSPSISKLVNACVIRACTKPNPPFPEPLHCPFVFEESTNWRERRWVGLRARLSSQLFREKLNWRQHPGIDPPTLRFRTSPCRLPRWGTNPGRKKSSEIGQFSSPQATPLSSSLWSRYAQL